MRMFLVVSLLTMGLLVATPTPAFACCHGHITIVKETDPDNGTGFNFSGDLGSFTLDDDESETFYKSLGWYNVTESVPSGWDLDSVVCTGGYSENITNGVRIHLESHGQHVTCTFNNIEQGGPQAERRIKASKFNDENGDGDKDCGEDWLNGWEFTLYRKESGVWVEKATATTAGSDWSKGTADFGEWPIGDEYKIVETRQDGWICTNCTNAEEPFTLQSVCCPCGSKEVEFGNQQPPKRRIKARKFNDKNGDGDKGYGEDWLNGWEFTLYRKESGVWVEKATATTTGSHSYKGTADFGEWPIGDEYKIVETRQDGWTCTNCTTAEQPFTLQSVCCPCGSKEVEFGNQYDGQSVCLPTIDFDTDAHGNPLAAGTIVAEQWAAWGVHVTTNDPTNHPAMIFDSSNPTGDDPDLGTPNEDFGGPGQGNGGKSGQPGENSLSQGKILIISEDNDPSDPDDNSGGGTIIFTFDEPTPVDDVYIMDIEIEEAGSKISAWNAVNGGTLLAQVYMQTPGDNSFQVVPVNADGVRRLEIFFKSSGGVPAIVFCRDKGSIGNYVWHDVNINGLQDDGASAGIADVTVNLYDDTDALLHTTQTDSSGYYIFNNLEAGDYYVEFVLPADYFFSPQDRGADDEVDSDADPTTGKTITTTLESGETDLTWDAGLHLCSIGDRVWHDEDKSTDQYNVLPDYKEPGFNGVDVYLYGSTPPATCGQTGYLAMTTTISGTSQDPPDFPDGIYLFDMETLGLGPGEYWVCVDESTLPPVPVGKDRWALTTVAKGNPQQVPYNGTDDFSFDFGYVAEGGPTAVTLSSLAARPGGGGSASRLWLGLAGLAVVVAGSLFWTKRRTG
jgi:hypothetical protein